MTYPENGKPNWIAEKKPWIRGIRLNCPAKNASSKPEKDNRKPSNCTKRTDTGLFQTTASMLELKIVSVLRKKSIIEAIPLNF